MNGGVALERKLFYPLYDTKGMEEGVKAFVEKRKPNHRDLWWFNSRQLTYLCNISLITKAFFLFFGTLL